MYWPFARLLTVEERISVRYTQTVLLTFALCTLIFICTGACGALLSVVLLREKNLVSVTSMSVVFGPSCFLFFSNALGYLLAIPLAFVFALSLVVLLDLLLFFVAWRRGASFSWFAFERPPMWFAWIMVPMIALATLANMRFLGSDPLVWHHLPLAATISEGNFPVMEPINPSQPMGYHYGAALLAAALHSFTGLSIASSYEMQALFGVAGILLFASAIAYACKQSWRAALIAGVLTLFGTGCVWFKGVYFAQDLIQHFLQGHHLEYPFRGLAPMFGSSITSSLLIFLGHRSLMTGYPVLFALLFSLLRLYGAHSSGSQWAWLAVSSIFACVLALTLETAFVLLLPTVLFYVLLLGIIQMIDRRPTHWKRSLLVSALLFLPVLWIARHQGGVLSAVGGDVGPSAFSLGLHSSVITSFNGERVSFFSLIFFRDFGLPLLLFPFATWFSWKKRHSSPFLLFLCIFAIGHFLVPFVVHFHTRPSDINRIFFTATALFSFLSGLWIEERCLQSRSLCKRISGCLMLGMMLLASTVYLLFRLTFPTFRFEVSPLLAPMPKATLTQHRLYDWVRTHSTFEDRFYLRVVPEIAAGNNDVPDVVMQQLDRILFMAYTGRSSVGPLSTWWYEAQPFRDATVAMEKHCLQDVASQLKIRYLVLETLDRATWFKKTCNENDWVLRYGTPQAVPRVYELKP